jgi:hypothetical protein
MQATDFDWIRYRVRTAPRPLISAPNPPKRFGEISESVACPRFWGAAFALPALLRK